MVSFCQNKPQKNMASLGGDHLSLQGRVSAVAENNYLSWSVLEVKILELKIPIDDVSVSTRSQK